MKKTLLCATAAAAFATVGATAHAEDGWYARADAQFSFEGTLDQDGATDVIGTIPGKSTLNETGGAAVGMGYGFENGLRLEGVLGNRGGPLDVSPDVNGAIGGTLSRSGYASVTDLMLNGLYDFNKGGTVRPYIGLGVGGARVDAKASNRVAFVGDDGNALNGFSDKSTGIADIKGKKIRVIPSAPARDFYELLGAAPTPVPFAGVYDALANGQVDGIDMDFEATFYNKYNQLAKTMLVTNHVMAPMAAAFSARVWRDLSEADQKLIRDLVAKQMKLIRNEFVANEEAFRKRLAEAGFEMRPVARETFAEVVKAWDARWEAKAPDLKALRTFTR